MTSESYICVHLSTEKSGSQVLLVLIICLQQNLCWLSSFCVTNKSVLLIWQMLILLCVICELYKIGTDIL